MIFKFSIYSMHTFLIFNLHCFIIFRTLSVKIGYWPYINICLNVLKYVIFNVLRLLCSIIAAMMFTLSSLLASLSEKLQTTDSVENLTRQINIKYRY